MKILLTLLLLIPSLSWGKLQEMGKTDITISEALEEGFEIIGTNSTGAEANTNIVHLYHKKQKRYLVCIVAGDSRRFLEFCGISKWKDYVPEDLTKEDK